MRIPVEAKDAAVQATSLDKDTMVIFALDIDDTTKKTIVPTGGDDSKGNVPKYCLSPKLIEFLLKEKGKAIDAGAICDSFLISTARCIGDSETSEIVLVNRDNEDHYNLVYSESGWLAWSKQSGYQLDLENFKPHYCFTHEVEAHVIEITGLKCLGTSTPDDAIEGRKFGDASRLAKPIYVKLAETPVHQYDKKGNPTYVQFAPTEELKKIPHVPKIKDGDKNHQIIQFASELAEKNPGKKIVIKMVDDSEQVLANAKKLTGKDLPGNVTLEIYEHLATFQTTPALKATIQGLSKAEKEKILEQEKKPDGILKALKLEINEICSKYIEHWDGASAFYMRHDPNKRATDLLSDIEKADSIPRIKVILEEAQAKSLTTATESSIDGWWKYTIKKCQEALAKHQELFAKVQADVISTATTAMTTDRIGAGVFIKSSAMQSGSDTDPAKAVVDTSQVAAGTSAAA